MSTTAAEPVRTEKHRVTGEQLLSRAKQLVHAGNIRRLIVRDDKDHTILEIPLSVGVVGAVLIPVWVALGAIAALAAHYTLEVVKHDE